MMIGDRDGEIEAFKSRINLSEYAASCGYLKDRKRSSRNCCMMKSGADKVAIGMGHDGHWTYYAIGAERDNGSIIDFIQNRGGGNLGEIRKELRPWLNGSASSISRPNPNTYTLKLEPVSKDLIQVQSKFAAMSPIAHTHDYLEKGRGLAAALLASERFSGRIFVDDRRNAVFPHRNLNGICGYEVKNQGFTGFAPGGEKGLWYSNFFEDDERLVIAETAIDALSYSALKGTTQTRFFSIGGSMNDVQPALLISAAEKMPEGSEIILALDNDEGGDVLTDQIQSILAQTNRSAQRLRVDRPPSRGQDWNDALRASMKKIETPFSGIRL